VHPQRQWPSVFTLPHRMHSASAGVPRCIMLFLELVKAVSYRICMANVLSQLVNAVNLQIWEMERSRRSVGVVGVVALLALVVVFSVFYSFSLLFAA
jgi:hypothetical protein